MVLDIMTGFEAVFDAENGVPGAEGCKKVSRECEISPGICKSKLGARNIICSGGR